MLNLIKLLFGKLHFGFADDPDAGGSDPNGQQGSGDGGNDSGDSDGDGDAGSPTDFVEVNGVKIPQSEFDVLAKDRYKDAFDAYENREKWQAENTRKAQENAEAIRKAQAYDRLIATQQSGQQGMPSDLKGQYLQEMQRKFSDVSPDFLEAQYNWMDRFAKNSLKPFMDAQGQQFERQFLKTHPDIQPGTPAYRKISDLVSVGWDAEEAYNAVNPDKLVAAAIKEREAEAKRKLQQSRQAGSKGAKPKGDRSRSDMIWDALEAQGMQRP